MLDDKTKDFIDKVAEEWIMAREKLDKHDLKIKENEVEYIEAVKTIVTEANIWRRFVRKNENVTKIDYSSKGKSSYKRGGGNTTKITSDTKLTFGKYSGKDGNPAKSLNEIAKSDMDYIGWLSKGGAKNQQLKKLAIDMFAKSNTQNEGGGSEWGF